MPKHPSASDAAEIRKALKSGLRRSKKSRAQIATEMTALSGRRVTERMVNNWVAKSRGDYSFPLDLERVFCAVTGDDKLLRDRVRHIGLRMIGREEEELIEIGRAWIAKRKAERRLEGSSL